MNKPIENITFYARYISMQKKLISLNQKTLALKRVIVDTYTMYHSEINIINKGKESLYIEPTNTALSSNNYSILKRVQRLFMVPKKLAITGRLFAIGDVHGSYTKLVKLAHMLDFAKEDIVIFLGDIIDRGLNTRDTIDFLENLKTKTNLVCLGGNHEAMFLQSQTSWVLNGGLETLLSYGATLSFHNVTKDEFFLNFEIPAVIANKLWQKMNKHGLANNQGTIINDYPNLKLLMQLILIHGERYGGDFANHIVQATNIQPLMQHAKFFQELRDFAWTDGSWQTHYHFSHAGINPNQKSDLECMLGISETRSPLLNSDYKSKYKYIFGHTPVNAMNLHYFNYDYAKIPFQSYRPYISDTCVNLDTEAFRNGPLTAIELPSESFHFSF